MDGYFLVCKVEFESNRAVEHVALLHGELEQAHERFKAIVAANDLPKHYLTLSAAPIRVIEVSP